MSAHRWKLKRVQVMREGELQAAVCEGCGAYRLALLPAGGGAVEVFATDPDPLPELCQLGAAPEISRSSQPTRTRCRSFNGADANRILPEGENRPKQAVLGIFGADRKVSTAQEAF